MAGLPVVLTLAGVQPTPPAVLQAELLAAVSAIVPGYTATLPGTLIEDISSTDVGAIVMCNGAVVELLNSITPYGANPFLLNQLGQVYGVQIGAPSNTSVLLVFSGTPNFVVAKGFVVSDGNVQYTLTDGGSVLSDGQSLPLSAVSTTPGTFPVPSSTVTQIISSVPPGITLSVVNPQPGIPGTDSETETSYRARVLQAGLAATSGMFSMLKTALGNVPGVQPRLISAIPQPGGGWAVIVGGGDQQAVAYAIYSSIFDISTLVGSSIRITGITNANPGVITTDLTHQIVVGETFEIVGTLPAADYDGTYQAQSIPNATSITLGKAYLGNQLTSQAFAGGDITFHTTSAHGVSIGSSFVIAGSAPSGYNGTFVAIAGTTGSTLVCVASDPGSSTLLGHLVAGIANFDTTSITPWTSGGIVTPNSRNVLVTIIDYPDTYAIPFIVPPQQLVTMTVTWNTNSPNFVSGTAIAQLGGPAIVDYINLIPTGKPINVFELQAVFQAAVAPVLSPIYLTRMVFSVSIDGVGVSPTSGTGIIQGDAQSFLFTQLTDINIVQG